MTIIEAIRIAQEKNKFIALPHDDKCETGGFRIKLKPYPNNLICYEFYGTKKELNQFSIAPKEIMRNDWIVIDGEENDQNDTRYKEIRQINAVINVLGINDATKNGDNIDQIFNLNIRKNIDSFINVIYQECCSDYGEVDINVFEKISDLYNQKTSIHFGNIIDAYKNL